MKYLYHMYIIFFNKNIFLRVFINVYKFLYALYFYATTYIYVLLKRNHLCNEATRVRRHSSAQPVYVYIYVYTYNIYIFKYIKIKYMKIYHLRPTFLQESLKRLQNRYYSHHTNSSYQRRSQRISI